MTITKRVLIVQPYVPTYRVPFFEALNRKFAEHGVSMKVAAPAARGSQAKRGDAAQAHPWIAPTTARHAEIMGVGFDYYGSRRLVETADLTVVPAAATCLDFLRAAAPRRRPTPWIAWGHIAAYVKEPNRIDQRIEKTLLRRASAVFAYTERGARQALDWGVEPQKVVSLGNTVDTSGLLAAAAEITDQEANDFITALGWDGCEVYGFLGALDDSKGIPFLVELLDHLRINHPNVRLLVGGRGDSEELLRPAVERGQINLLGYVGDSEKAMMGAVCRSLIFTGRVGLAAVEAIALNIPVITAHQFDHAPEIEYLIEGQDLFYAEPTPAAFARSIAAVGQHRVPDRRPAPPLAGMVNRFFDGCIEAASFDH